MITLRSFAMAYGRAFIIKCAEETRQRRERLAEERRQRAERLRRASLGASPEDLAAAIAFRREQLAATQDADRNAHDMLMRFLDEIAKVVEAERRRIAGIAARPEDAAASARFREAQNDAVAAAEWNAFELLLADLVEMARAKEAERRRRIENELARGRDLQRRRATIDPAALAAKRAREEQTERERLDFLAAQIARRVA